MQPHGTPQRHVGEVRGAAGVRLQVDDGAGVRGDGEVQDVLVGDGQLGAHAGHAADGYVVAAVQVAAGHAQAGGEPDSWAEVAGGVKATTGIGGGLAEAVGRLVIQRQGGRGVVLMVGVQVKAPIARVLIAGQDRFWGVDLQRGDARVLGRPAVAVLLHVRVAFLWTAAVDGCEVHGLARLDAVHGGIVVIIISGLPLCYHTTVVDHGSFRHICKKSVFR